MKKKTIIISTVLVLLFLVANLTVVVSSGMLKRQELSWDENPGKTLKVFLKEKDQEGKLQGAYEEVPIYLEEELLFKTDGLFFLNRDACFYDDTNWRPNDAGAIMAAYPHQLYGREAINPYTIYETDTGYRLYLMFDSSSDYATTTGFPLLLRMCCPMLSFPTWKVGDAIEKVEAIDSVATLHKKNDYRCMESRSEGRGSTCRRWLPMHSYSLLKKKDLKN